MPCLPVKHVACLSGLLLAVSSVAATPETRPAVENDLEARKAELRERVAPSLNRAMRYLAGAQDAEGGWAGMAGRPDPAISALVTKCFIQHPDYGPRHEIVQRAWPFILRFQQPDGGVYEPRFGYGNYSTSVVLMALSAMDDERLKPEIEAAQGYLTGNQWVEGKTDADGEVIDEGHPWYGGAGYGRHRRPDLSNTQMMVEALHASGLPADDPAYQKAMKFISRCQMLSQTNDMPFARGATDGGMIYTPANDGESMAGTVLVDGRPMLRSYGSMTYAGFKSMLYAQVDRDDQRVQAAWDWIRKHYTLASNPNMPGAQSKEGLYYYYHVFAKALEAWGEPFVVDHEGARHDWRAELADHLLEAQNADGSWLNEADRWQEGNPYLVTAYAVLALQTALR